VGEEAQSREGGERATQSHREERSPSN
jgi:hypothetical protein